MSKDHEEHKKSALQELDMAGWTKAHWRAVLVAGSGFLTDSYDNFVIGLMVTMIGYVYFPYNKNAVPTYESSWLKAASSWGNLVGQFFFGVMGDVFGRKKMYGVELIILMIGAVGSALAAQPVRGLGIAGVLGFWRFILGVGVGGDYPVSGVITSEFASVKSRGTMIALVFAMQGVGIILGTIVAIISLVSYKDLVLTDQANLDYVWRCMAGFGVVPAMCAVYYRLTIPETPRFAMDVEGDVVKGAAAARQYLAGQTKEVIVVTEKKERKSYATGFREYFGKWRNARTLIACALCWFFLDIGYYGTNLNTPSILQFFGYAAPSTATAYEKVWTLATGTAIVNLAGNFPGYFFTVAFVDRWGRKPIQFMGFAILTLCFLFLGLFYNQLKTEATAGFVALYCAAQFFFNFGPNQTTFIIPAEAFPTHVRSTAHGISAATGKLGAIIAAQLFDPISKNPVLGVEGTVFLLYIFSGCCAVGFLLTFWVPETNGKSLEELAEDY
ncbi:major facilitator superfamily domain-containing protein [Gorgonomyces haynaldii]|nr:major facilitator superfamily domain-containing protein [Gorgonomyces haynaldii]